jgi:hypothetical protein
MLPQSEDAIKGAIKSCATAIVPEALVETEETP